MKRLILMMTAALMAVAASAQKFGHIDSQALIEQLPDYKDAQKTLDQKAAAFEEQMTTLNEEFQKQLADAQANADKLTEEETAQKQKELQEMYAKVQGFQRQAQETLQKEQQTLLQPILMRVQRIVQEVGVEGGYLYIFEKQAGLTPFVSESLSEDITPLVKKKLGIN